MNGGKRRFTWALFWTSCPVLQVLMAGWRGPRLSSNSSLGHFSKIKTRSATDPLVKNGLIGLFPVPVAAAALICCFCWVVNSGWGTCSILGLGELILGPHLDVTGSFSSLPASLSFCISVSNLDLVVDTNCSVELKLLLFVLCSSNLCWVGGFCWAALYLTFA